MWIIFFLYAVVISLLIQLLILPIILPQYHMGHGLLDGGDWTFYHSKAVEISYNINANGWSHWELRPRGFGLLGVISALYSFFGVYEPYVLIPFFSALHALGAISIVSLIEKMGVERAASMFSALPFLVFPSSLLWVTQILKDIFTINGALLILLGLVSIVSIAKEHDFICNIKKTAISCYSYIIWFSVVMVG